MNKQLNTFYQLVLHDMITFFKDFKDKFIDACIMLSTNLLLFGYLMPHLGLQADYGSFILIGNIATFGLFEVLGRVSGLIQHLESTITYKLMLPIKTWLIFCSIAISWAIQSTVLSLVLIPLGKLILYSQFSLSQISIVKFILILIATNLFYGFFALFLTSFLKGMKGISHLWVRIIGPMYFFGCYFYPWKLTFDVSPIVGYLSLLNPMVYIMEGMRSAMLGPEGYLPFWFSLGALILFIVAFSVISIKRLKKRLDAV